MFCSQNCDPLFNFPLTLSSFGVLLGLSEAGILLTRPQVKEPVTGIPGSTHGLRLSLVSWCRLAVRPCWDQDFIDAV